MEYIDHKNSKPHIYMAIQHHGLTLWSFWYNVQEFFSVIYKYQLGYKRGNIWIWILPSLHVQFQIKWLRWYCSTRSLGNGIYKGTWNLSLFVYKRSWNLKIHTKRKLNNRLIVITCYGEHHHISQYLRGKIEKYVILSITFVIVCAVS